MKVYRFFSGFRLLKNYNSKVMFIAVAGIYIPLIAVIGLLLFGQVTLLNQIAIALLTLGVIVIAAVITSFLIASLLAPVRKVQVSLTAYLKYGGMPDLPENFDDELGLLMRTVNNFVGTVHHKLNEKDKLITALSHDLRAPAANILTNINLLKTETNAGEIDKHLKNIDALINRQLKVMDGLAYNCGDKINYSLKRFKTRGALNKSEKVLL